MKNTSSAFSLVLGDMPAVSGRTSVSLCGEEEIRPLLLLIMLAARMDDLVLQCLPRKEKAERNESCTANMFNVAPQQRLMSSILSIGFEFAFFTAGRGKIIIFAFAGYRLSVSPFSAIGLRLFEQFYRIIARLEGTKKRHKKGKNSL